MDKQQEGEEKKKRQVGRMREEGGEENRGERATEEHNILKLTAHA